MKTFSCFWNHFHIQGCRLHLPAGRCHLPKYVSIQGCLYFSRMLKKVAQSICYMNDTTLHFSAKYWPNHDTASKCLLLFHNWPWCHHLFSIMTHTHTLPYILFRQKPNSLKYMIQLLIENPFSNAHWLAWVIWL